MTDSNVYDSYIELAKELGFQRKTDLTHSVEIFTIRSKWLQGFGQGEDTAAMLSVDSLRMYTNAKILPTDPPKIITTNSTQLDPEEITDFSQVRETAINLVKKIESLSQQLETRQIMEAGNTLRNNLLKCTPTKGDSDV